MSMERSNQGGYCAECGTELASADAFCPNCGTPVAVMRENVAPEPQEKSSPIAPSNEVPAASSIPASPPAKSGSKTITYVVLGVVVALILVALLVLGFFVLRSAGSNGDGLGSDPGNGVGGGYPVVFTDETLQRYPTPAQLVYYHFISQLYDANGGNVEVGSPKLSPKKVDIRIRFDGRWENWRMVESENDGKKAVVAIGLADAGAYEFYVLQKVGGKWQITGGQDYEELQ